MPKLKYSNQGRSGYVIYTDEISSLQFYFEFGGGNCVAIINFPSPDKWTHETKRPLHERQQVLDFLGKQIIKDQAPNCIYKEQKDSIEILKTS